MPTTQADYVALYAADLDNWRPSTAKGVPWPDDWMARWQEAHAAELDMSGPGGPGGPGGPAAVEGPSVPAFPKGPGRRRSRRLHLDLPRPRRAALLVVVSAGLVAAMSAVLVIAAKQTDRSTAAISSALTQAEQSFGAAGDIGSAADARSFVLTMIRAADQESQARAQRPSPWWTIARWSVRSSQTRQLDRQSQALMNVAEAGRPVGTTMALALTGSVNPERLTTAANALAGYLAAINAAGLPADQELRRLRSVIAAMEDFSGPSADRRILVCPATAAPCNRLVILRGKVITNDRVAVTDADTIQDDIVVRGVRVEGVVAGQYLSAPRLFALIRQTAMNPTPAVQVSIVQPMVT